MTRLILISILAATVIAAAANAGVRGSEQTITIRHQTVGCHTWSVDGGPWRAAQVITLRAGEKIEFVNDDAMSHRLVELAGPRLALPPTLLVGTYKHPGAGSAAVTFTQRGTYRLKTIDGEGTARTPPTSGADNVLRLTVHVR